MNIEWYETNFTTKIAMSGFLKSQICFAEKPLMQI